MIKKPNKTTGLEINTFEDRRGWWFGLIIGSILLCLSFVWNKRVDRLAASEQFGGQSNGFHGGPIVDSYRAPRIGEYRAAQQLPVVFQLSIPASAQKLSLSFKYRTPSDFHSLWLSIPAKNGSEPTRLLVDHAVFRNNPLPLITGTGDFLFQKNITYTSVKSFLQSFTSDSKIWADGSLIYKYERSLNKLLPFQPLETYDGTAGEIDYILTTFVKPRLFPDGWLEFGRVIDISQAERTSRDTLLITLSSDQAVETIDYMEPEVYYH